MKLIPTLNLNKHPKDCENVSLIDAQGMKLSNDSFILTNEEGIDVIPEISEQLKSFYTQVNYTIVGCIPCNTEIVLIVNVETDEYCNIFRYNEKTKLLQLSYNKFKYHGGSIKGAYTYNVEGSLIIAIAEDASNTVYKVPLRTINLGNIDNGNVANDQDLSDDYTSISPKIKLPSINNVQYITGNAYKGWYYLFIRFKLNTIDYTNWFSFGWPIYIDQLKAKQIIRYCFDQTIDLTTIANVPDHLYRPDGYRDGYGVGCSDSFSDDLDICSETFKLSLNFNNIDYSVYQLGFICASKAYTKGYYTSDLTKNDSNIFIFDNKRLSEISASDFIKETYNYYNVKNIINYNNRLYISNYQEDLLNDASIINTRDEIGRNTIDKIKIDLVVGTIPLNDIHITQIIGIAGAFNNNSQYEILNGPFNYLTFAEYFNVSNDTKFKINGVTVDNTTINDTFEASNIKIKTKDAIYPDVCSIEINYSSYVFKFISIINYTNINNGNSGTINCHDLAIAGAIKYLQPNSSFNLRKQYSTLLPGEVYNLFIHFTFNGHATNGYKLNNYTKRIISNTEQTECTIIPVKTPVATIYAVADINEIISINNGYYNIRFFTILNNDGTVSNEIIEPSIKSDYLNYFIQQYSTILNNKSFEGYKLYQIFNNGFIGEKNIFGKHTNNNGDNLFKIPEDTNQYSNEATIYNISVSGVSVPQGYDGYFISYEKFEATKRVTGLLTRNDFTTESKYIDYSNGSTLVGARPTSNVFDSDKMFFYSSKFDIDDTLKLDYNLLTITAKNCFDNNEILPYDYWQRNCFMSLPYDYNKTFITRNNIPRQIYAIPKFKLCPADSMKHDRAGLGTALQLSDSYNLFINKPYNELTSEETIITYLAELSNISNNLYMSKNKTLIRLSETITSSNVTTIVNGYNGHITYDGTLVYNGGGLIFNETDFTARRLRTSALRYYPSSTANTGKHSYMANTPFVNYLQFMVYDDYFYESKSFNNEPANYIFPIKGLATTNPDDKSYFPGNIVEPKNSIDLFKNKQTSSDQFNPKTYSNYRDDLVNNYIFNKTIRRSNIIQDESRINAWRSFPLEGYKNIIENKGNITNIIGIGVYLLVHTEHSLFMFNRDSALKADNKDIQLLQPDTFDIDYQEVLTSDHGYGGLQDSLSCIIDQFGYIYYNENFTHLYKFDNGKLEIIDDNFYLWLDKYKPHSVRMANDKANNRILMKFEFTVETKNTNGTIIENNRIEVFSFNYIKNELISSHKFIFNEAFNTETNLYLLPYANNGIFDNLYTFIKNDKYGYIAPSIINPDYLKDIKILENYHYFNSSISIIINLNYADIKFLEFIKYKLKKINRDTKYTYNYNPTELNILNYAGDIIRIYGENCDTGELNIDITDLNKFNNYKKPWYELGTWNFNYFGNNIKNYPTISGMNISRIYGNYIIIQFIFDNKDNELIEFEDIDIILSKQRI